MTQAEALDELRARLRCGGDGAAVMELYDRIAPIVYGYALARATPDTAAAVCREAFLTAWRCPAMFQDDRVPITLTLLQLARRRLGDTPPA